MSASTILITRQMLAALWGEPKQYQHAIVSVLLTVSSNGTEPGSVLLPAENNLGICLSLSQRLQLPLSSRVDNGDESIELPYRPSKMIA